MSCQLCGIVWDLRVTSKEKLVLLMMADNSANDLALDLGDEQSATRCGMSLKKLRNIQNRLTKKGVLTEVLDTHTGCPFYLLNDKYEKNTL